MDKNILTRVEYTKKNKYIDLKIHGRLFPSWVLANFKDYKLPEIIRKAGEDPCNKKDKGGVKRMAHELRKYQEFASQYLDYMSPYRNILIYHGLGSGKTANAINIYNSLYNYTPGWNVFLMIKASLKSSWLKELKTWLKKDEYEFRFKNIIFIHYDSPFADRDFFDAIKNVDNSKKNMFIIDEVHNFIRNVYSNISSGQGKRALAVYDYIIQDKKENQDTRVILVSATPAINNPFELGLLFNLLRPGIFPRSENEFNELFISGGSYKTISKINKNLFQRRIMGLVSYYYGSTPDYFATKSIQYVDVPMSDYQTEIYNIFEEIEEKIAAQAKLAGKTGSKMYKSYTRQACNFIFPQIDQNVNGEGRPRPNKFRMTIREAEKIIEGRAEDEKEGLKIEKGTEKYMNVSKYMQAMGMYITKVDEYFHNADKSDIAKNHTIMNDVNIFIEKYKGDFAKFNSNEKKKSELYLKMTTSSMKMVNIIFNIMFSPGPTIVYSNYVFMEGLQIFKLYLKYFGFYNFMEKKKIIPDQTGYTEFHGAIKDRRDRDLGMEQFNKTENKHGKFIKIMLISPAGSEGLSLRNVRQAHMMEPYWNEVRITQMIGRAVRLCSHADLPIEDRHVDVFRYKSVRTNSDKWTTDQYIEDLARSKDGLIQSFLDSIKEAAVDCVLNKNHNMLAQEYKCFNFDEPSLFNKYIGPAYKDDIYDDMKIDNGLNSTKSIVTKVKVREINAVIQMTNDDSDSQDVKYSKSEKYWYNPKTGVIYDHELHYSIGKVAMNIDGQPEKLDKDTYIIDQLIPIPHIDN